MSERRPRPRPVRKSVLIVCEGSETEPCYFARLKQTLGLDATVDVVDGNTGYTDPIGLVNATLKRIDKRKRDARNSTTLTAFEEMWVTACVGFAYGKERAPAQTIAAWAMPRTPVALKHGAAQDVFEGSVRAPGAHVPSAVGTGVHRLVQSLVEMSSDAAGKRQLGFK